MSTDYLVQEPQQTRSKETMDRLLQAAAELLEEKSFDELTINDVVERAGSSVGAFYGRFKDKNGLLEALDVRFFTGFEDRLNALLQSRQWKEAPMAVVIADLTRLMVDLYSKDRGVMRALVLKARQYDNPRFKRREQYAWKTLFPRLQVALLSHADEIRHPDPLLATRLGFQQMFFTMREILLWEPLRGGMSYDTEALIAELTRGFVAYLNLPPTEEPV
jgi:AcrR family transcriptional regulator